MEAVKANAGKIALVVVLIAAAIALFAFQNAEAPKRSGQVEYICVKTGKTFWFKRSPTVLPRENPETHEKTLVPCHQTEDGQLVIDPRQRAVIQQLEKNGLNKYVDPETLVVRKNPQ